MTSSLPPLPVKFLTSKRVRSLLVTPLLSALIVVGAAPQAQAHWLVERVQALFQGDRVEGRASGRSRGGAVRGDSCSFYNNLRVDASEQESLLALIPTTTRSKTTLGYPTFWFYLPTDRSGSAIRAEFDLQDADDDSLLEEEITLQLPEKPGVVSVRWPVSESPLEAGQAYHWYLTIVCDEENPDSNTDVHGEIIRVENKDINSEIGLAVDSDQDRLAIYAKHGIWHDLFTLIANSNTEYPEAWTTLLSEFGLGNMSEDVNVEQLAPL